jgi:hypothetical protein
VRSRSRFVGLSAGACVAVVSVLIVSMARAPRAFAYWVAPETGACAGQAPPQGQTGGFYWVNGEAGTCSGDWMSQDQMGSLVDRGVAASDEATGTSVPSDISAGDAQAGTGFWDGLAGADSPVKGNALDFLIEEGGWPTLDAMPPVALGAGAFVVGWKVGSMIANFLGLETGTASSGGGGNTIMVGPANYGMSACAAGDYLTVDSNPAPCASTPPSTCGQLTQCVPSGARVPQDGFVVGWATGGGNWYSLPEPCYGESNIPSGAQKLIVANGSTVYTSGCPVGPPADEASFFIPMTVTALPGPNQGATTPSQTVTNNPPTQIPESQQKQNVQATLQSASSDAFTQYQCAAYGPSGPCPFWALIPTPGSNESASDYATQLQQEGLQVNVTTLPETDTTVGNGGVVQTNPEPGSVVATNSTVNVAANPGVPKVSQEDPRCDVDNGDGSPGDPGPAPPDGTKYPPYQLVGGSPYTADVDPSNSSPPQTQIPLRWGKKEWGWRHILQKHPYSSADDEQTEQALATDPSPMPSWTNQWVFHYFYKMPDGSGGTIECVRSVSVDYYQDDKAAKQGVSGIRGIQDSYVGLYTGGVPGH